MQVAKQILMLCDKIYLSYMNIVICTNIANLLDVMYRNQFYCVRRSISWNKFQIKKLLFLSLFWIHLNATLVGVFVLISRLGYFDDSFILSSGAQWDLDSNSSSFNHVKNVSTGVNTLGLRSVDYDYWRITFCMT